MTNLEAVDLDRLHVKPQTLLLVGEKLLNVLSLVSLKLDHFAHFGVGHDGAIAGWRLVSVCFPIPS